METKRVVRIYRAERLVEREPMWDGNFIGHRGEETKVSC